MRKYSFIIPTFGREEYLLCAVASINKIEVVNKEIIVVDDNPESKVFEHLDQKIKNMIIYIKNDKNRGPGYSRKVGFLKSTGEYIIFMDDDDFYTATNFLKYAQKIFQQYQNLSFISFNANNYYMKNHNIVQEGMLNRIGLISGAEYLKNFQIVINKPKSTFTSIFKKAALIDAGINEMEIVNDASIFLRVLLVGDAYLSDTIIGNYRIHDSNITKTLSAEFIVENLVEKEKVFNLLKFNNFNRYKWLYEQSKVSVIYFYFNNEEYSKDTAIIKWIQNQEFLVRILLLKDVYISILKRKIKKVIRG